MIQSHQFGRRQVLGGLLGLLLIPMAGCGPSVQPGPDPQPEPDPMENASGEPRSPESGGESGDPAMDGL